MTGIERTINTENKNDSLREYMNVLVCKCAYTQEKSCMKKGEREAEKIIIKSYQTSSTKVLINLKVFIKA